MKAKGKNIFAFITSHKKLSIIAAIVLVGGIFFWNKTHATTSPQYQTATATRGTLVSSVTESGQVSVANRVSITTQASGVVATVYVKNGDTVTTGEKIADITVDNAGQQRQTQAYANYLSAKSTLDAANAQMLSLQSSMFSDWQTYMNQATSTTYQNSDGSPNLSNRVATQFTVPQTAWEAAQQQYQNQQTVIAQAQAAQSAAWLSYQNTSATIDAPSAGTITDLTITPGMQVGSSATSSVSTSTSTGGSTGTSATGSNSSSGSSQAIASITTGGTPIINVSLSEVDAAKVTAGNKATVTFDALPNQTFTGKVTGINTTGVVSSGVTTYPATIVLDTPNDHILPNMSATASIITGVKDNVLMVPSGAVQSSGGQSAVRVLKNGQVTQVPVETGASSDTDMEIVSGLSEGDVVVTGVSSAQASGSTSSPFSRSPFGGGGFGGGGRGGGGRGGGG